MGCIAAAIVGAGVGYGLYPSTIRKRLRKYVEREYGSSMPARTTYSLDGQTIRCDSLGVSISYHLDDLKEVVEDVEALELSFGAKGLCLIPVRAYKTSEEKNAFLSTIKNANNAIHRTPTRFTPDA